MHYRQDLTGSTGTVSFLATAVSTAANFVNSWGADAVSGGTGRWIVYAADCYGSTYGELDSSNSAFWGDTLATRPPAQVSGNRYVFATERTLTFMSLDGAKTYGDDLTVLCGREVVLGLLLRQTSEDGSLSERPPQVSRQLSSLSEFEHDLVQHIVPGPRLGGGQRGDGIGCRERFHLPATGGTEVCRRLG